MNTLGSEEVILNMINKFFILIELQFNGGGIKQLLYCRDFCRQLWLKKKRRLPDIKWIGNTAFWCSFSHLEKRYQSVSNTAIKVQCDQEYSTTGRRIGIQNTQKVCSFPLFLREFDACSIIALSSLWSFPLFIHLYSLWPLASRKVLPTEYWPRLYQLTMKTML